MEVLALQILQNRHSWRHRFIFSAGGLDSLGAVEYVNLVGRRLNLRLPTTLVFDYPTAAAVTTYLAATLAAKQPASKNTAAASGPAQAAAVPRALAPDAGTDALKMQHAPIFIKATLLWPLSEATSCLSVSSVSGVLSQSDAITRIPLDRWSPDVSAGVTAEVARSVSATRFGAFLDQVDQFDMEAFGLSSAEAVNMDPQHRLLLASAAQLLAAPGSPTDSVVAGKGTNVQLGQNDTGVFIGISWTEYHQLGRMCGQPLGANSAQGAVLSVACGR